MRRNNYFLPWTLEEGCPGFVLKGTNGEVMAEGGHSELEFIRDYVNALDDYNPEAVGRLVVAVEKVCNLIHPAMRPEQFADLKDCIEDELYPALAALKRSKG